MTHIDTKEDAISRTLATWCVGRDRDAETIAAAVVSDLRAAGFIIVRHDAIRLAQAHARADK